MATEKQVAANKQNATKSTGPKTDEGKKQSSQNAVKHGLTADPTTVLPGEEPGAFEATLQTWYRDAKPQNVIEAALVKRACVANWKLERATRVEEALLAEKRRHASLDFAVKGWQDVVKIGTKLWNDPVNRALPWPYSDEKRDKFLAEAIERDPEILVHELERTAQGLHWLLCRWVELHAALDLDNFWHWPEKFLACRLLKRWPEDVMNDKVVRRIFLCCHVLHPEAWEYANDVIQCVRWEYNHPSYQARIEVQLEERPATREEAILELSGIMNAEVERIHTLLDKRRVEFYADRNEAPRRVTLDADVASRLLCYEAAHQRDLHRSLTALAKIRKDGTIPPSDEFEIETYEPQPPVAAAPEPAPAPDVIEEPIPKPNPQPTLQPRKPRKPKSPNEPNSRPKFQAFAHETAHVIPTTVPILDVLK